VIVGRGSPEDNCSGSLLRSYSEKVNVAVRHLYYVVTGRK
jgi:hypothetical protein